MPRTGTRTLSEALRILGFDAMHEHRARLPLIPIGPPNVRVFDDVDAVADCPAVLYWERIAATYQPKVILTVRELGSWWESIKHHTNQIRTGDDLRHIRYTDALHTLLFGIAQPCKYWWQRRCREHNNAVRGGIAGGQLLVMDIVAGDKWDVLCPFLGVEEPDAEWPWENKKATNA